jgi:hypothetical protein
MTHAAKSLRLSLGVAALILCGFIAAAPAQNAPASGQQPPAASGHEPPPVAEPGTTAQGACISENDGYEMRGNSPTFVITLENKCEQRLKCEIFASISSARGSAKGHTTMVLGAKSSGAAAKKSYAIKVKMIGGMSQSDRACKAI